MKKILLLTDFSSGYSRSLLRGIVQYSKEHGPWVFYRMPLYYRELHGDDGVVQWAKKWKADAIPSRKFAIGKLFFIGDFSRNNSNARVCPTGRKSAPSIFHRGATGGCRATQAPTYG